MMTLTCACGNQMIDQYENHPYKARCFADGDDEETFAALLFFVITW